MNEQAHSSAAAHFLEQSSHSPTGRFKRSRAAGTKTRKTASGKSAGKFPGLGLSWVKTM
jgi:hypothetical protein